jgi:tetratricopeptide (TPR) repeat protein
MRTTLFAAFMLALLCSPSTAAAPDSVVLNLSLPDLTWAVQLQVHGWIVDQQYFQDDFNERAFIAHDSLSGLSVSAYIIPAAKDGDASKARDYTLERLRRRGPELQDVRTYDSGQVAYVTYLSQLVRNLPDSRARNTYAFVVRDDKWVKVNLSRFSPRPDEQRLFDDFLGSIKIVENYSQSSLDYFVYGSWSYLEKNYKRAAEYYQAALDLEKVKRTLPEYYWLVVVDNLAMSYGIPGDSKKAKKVLEYGISIRPDYPMFHYNKACAFAEEKNLDSALHYLARANELRFNMIPSETMPNPAEDNSFKRFKKDTRLKTLIEFWGRDPL